MTTAFRLLTGPIGAVTLAIGALVAGGVLLYKNWDTVKYYALQAWGSIKVFVLNAIDAIAGAYEKLYGWVPILGDKIRAIHAKIRQSIEEEQGILESRSKESGTIGMADFRKLDNESAESKEKIDALGSPLDNIALKMGGSAGAAKAART